MSELLKQVSAHLEFFGYSVRYEEGILKATHTTRPSFWVYTLAGGALFRTLFALGKGASENRSELLDFVDRANGLTIVGRYHTSDQAMVIDAWFPDSYSKSSFGIFFDQYLADMQAPGPALQPLTNKLFPPDA